MVEAKQPTDNDLYLDSSYESDALPENITIEDVKVELSSLPPSQPPPSNQSSAKGLEIPDAWIAMIIDFPYDYLATRYGNHWKLTEPELRNLVKYGKPVLTKYLGWLFTRFPEEAMFLLAFAFATVPRVLQQRKMNKESVKNVKHEAVDAAHRKNVGEVDK